MSMCLTCVEIPAVRSIESSMFREELSLYNMDLFFDSRSKFDIANINNIIKQWRLKASEWKTATLEQRHAERLSLSPANIRSSASIPPAGLEDQQAAIEEEYLFDDPGTQLTHDVFQEEKLQLEHCCGGFDSP